MKSCFHIKNMCCDGLILGFIFYVYFIWVCVLLYYLFENVILFQTILPLLCGWNVTWHQSPGLTLRRRLFWEVTMAESRAFPSVLMGKSCCQEGKIRYCTSAILHLPLEENKQLKTSNPVLTQCLPTGFDDMESRLLFSWYFPDHFLLPWRLDYRMCLDLICCGEETNEHCSKVHFINTWVCVSVTESQSSLTPQLSCSSDCKLRIWDIQTGHLLREILTSSSLSTLCCWVNIGHLKAGSKWKTFYEDIQKVQPLMIFMCFFDIYRKIM